MTQIGLMFTDLKRNVEKLMRLIFRGVVSALNDFHRYD